MPLPSNGSLSLLGYSRPGDTVQSRPKQAMIVRMSVETLDALETFPSQPQLDFEFGDMPGLYIGDKFFSMRPAKEETPHELYLRASSAVKKMAPLKLYATVIGKFTVERELGEGVRDKVRESTQDAVNQRLNRTTILLDSIPDIPVASKKRKEPPSLFRKAPRPSDQVKQTSTSSSTTATLHTASPVPRQAPKEGGVTLRKKVIHLIAVNECTFNEVLQKLEANANASIRREVLELLNEVAEGTSAPRGTSDKAPMTYRLKASSWREVRPYEWPFSDQDKIIVSRMARMALKNLGIPENDPIWSHVKFRPPTNSNTTNNSSSISSSSRAGPATSSATGAIKGDAPKRGVSSKEVKEKMMKPKADRNADIKMKDESARVLKEENARVSREESASTARSQIGHSSRDFNPNNSRLQGTMPGKTTSKAVAAAASARKPGSGFKMSKSPSNDGDRDTLNESQRQPHVAPRVKKEAQPTAVSSPAPTRSAAASSTTHDRRAEYSAKRYRDEGAAASDSERDRYRPREREKAKERARVREKEEGEHSEDSAALKRRKHVRDADDYDDPPRISTQKRRKTDTVVSKNLPPRDYNSRDSGLPSKPDVEAPARKQVKRERSPSLPIPRIKKDISTGRQSVSAGGKVTVPSTAQNVGDKSSKSNKSNVAKARRRSPKYTSSEEEGERPRTNRREQPSTFLPPPSITTQSRTLNTSSSSSSSHNRLPSQPHPQDRNESVLQSRTKKPLPSDHASLRDRYNASYLEYLTTFQKLVAQKGKIDSLLKSNDAGSVTDSDGDVELLDLDELARLTNDHKQLEEELEAILRIFPRAGKDGSGSD